MFSWLLSTTVSLPNDNADIADAALSTASIEQLTTIPPGDYGMAFVKMFVTLIAFVLLLFGTFWFLRRLINQRLQKGVGSQAIQILEKRMISPKTMLYLVEVENKKVLIAESQVEVKRISELESAPHP